MTPPLVLGTVLIALAGSALAEITVQDAYLRSTMPAAKTGAAFMVLVNDGDRDDRLIGVRSDVAALVELHTHVPGDGGVMQMLPVEGGIVVPAGGEHRLERGGDHVMLMGLVRALPDGTTVPLTLIFETGGEITLEVPVDRSR